MLFSSMLATTVVISFKISIFALADTANDTQKVTVLGCD